MPNKHFMYSAQVLTQDLYPRFINTIRDLSGGALIMLPSSIEDFKDPMLKQDHPHHPARRDDGAGGQGEIPQGLLGRDRLGVRLAAQQYEMFYAGARFVTAGHSFRTYRLEFGANGMVENLLSSYTSRRRTVRARSH